jgi:dihydroorotate dehydrogenase electron transfer subunit
LNANLPRVARIVSVREESPTVRTLVLDAHLAAQPGQFVMAWLPDVNVRPFSLVCAEPVTLSIARVGPFTEAVHCLRPGDRLWLRGPLGRGFSLPAPAAHGGRLLFVAGGYGAAPLHFLAARATAAGWVVQVVIGARSAAEVILAGEFRALGAEVQPATDDGSLGFHGLATEAAEALLTTAGDPFRAVYACGPEPMLAAVERLARAHRLPAQLSYERAMRCAFGVCGTCSRDGWLVCKDGPVKALDICLPSDM